MSEEEKIKYLIIALNLQGISVSERIADQLIQTYEKLVELEGNFSLRDAAKIEAAIQEKYKKDA